MVGPTLGFALESGRTWRSHKWLNLDEVKLIVSNLGFNTQVAFLSLEVQVKVEKFRDC